LGDVNVELYPVLHQQILRRRSHTRIPCSAAPRPLAALEREARMIAPRAGDPLEKGAQMRLLLTVLAVERDRVLLTRRCSTADRPRCATVFLDKENVGRRQMVSDIHDGEPTGCVGFKCATANGSDGVVDGPVGR